MKVITLVSDTYRENTYILVNDSFCVVVDPGADAGEIQSQITNLKLQIKYILLTHGHYDHILGALALHSPIYAHENEKILLENSGLNLSAYAGTADISLDKVIFLNGENGKLDEFEFIHTPGHTAGCMVVKTGNILFTGDTLFLDTVGRTDVPTGDSKQLLKSLKVFDTLDKNLVCYPGHGEPFILADAYKVNCFLR
jgi:hydroxyacylglutathione hydrolase